MNSGKVRSIAIGIFRKDDRMLVVEWFDTFKGEQFYRPLGGGIEFGEWGRDCLIREIREEIGAEIEALEFIGTLENIFIYEGEPGHEIVLVYEGRFSNPDIYNAETVPGIEEGASFTAKWKKIEEFRRGEAILYPTGLLDLLDKAY